MPYKNGTTLNSEAHSALADGIRIMVEAMGPQQRRRVAKQLAEQAGDYEDKAATLLVRLALYVEPAS